MRQVFLVAILTMAIIVFGQITEEKTSNDTIQKKIGQWHVDIALADLTIQQAHDSLKN